MKLSSREKQCREFAETALDYKDEEWVKTSERLTKAIKGDYTNGFSRKKRYVINEAFSLVNLIIPNFIFNQPYLICKANRAKLFKKVKDGFKQSDGIRAARRLQAAINHHYTYTNIIAEDRKAIQDALIYPFGVCKDGYSFETVIQDDKDYILKDTGFRKRINPRDFGYDQMATDPSDSAKLVHQIVMTRDQCLKRGIKIDGKGKTDALVPGLPEYMTKALKKKNKDKVKDSGEYYTFKEVHDQENDEIYLFGGENNILIEKKKRIYQYTESDFSVITFTKDNDEFNGIPMLAMIEPQMVALNEIMQLMMEHLRKFPGQVYMNKDSVDEDQIEKIRTGVQGSAHVVNDINGILRASPLQMGNEYFSILNTVFSVIDRILGIPDFQRASGSGRKSATEASFIQGDASVRRNYFLGIVKEFVLSGVRKQSSLIKQFQDEKLVIDGGPMLDGEIFEFDKRDIQIEVDHDFDVDNMTAYNEAQINNINNLLLTFKGDPFFQPILARLDPFKFGKKLFKMVKMDYEEMSLEGIPDIVYYPPDKENKIALDGALMPRPKEDENHEQHLAEHKSAIEQRIKELGPQVAQADYAVNQIMEHIAEHQMLMEPIQPQEQQQNMDMMNQQEAMQPQGPQGPMTPMEGV